MAELTFRSPGFFDREIDISHRLQAPIGIPAAVIATAERGPAFVPVVVGDFQDFAERFGTLNTERFGPYAVREFLKTQKACTFMRVLGCGANLTQGNIDTTQLQGTVTNAGFVISGSNSFVDEGKTSTSLADWHPRGGVQFIAARRYVSSSSPNSEIDGYPIFSDNDSFPGTETGDDHINLLSAILFCATGTVFQVLDSDRAYSPSLVPTPFETSRGTDVVNVHDSTSAGGMPAFCFKLVLSNSDGASFGGADDQTGIKIFTASLDPQSPFYISNFLNTDPLKFQEKKHLLYADFPVDTRLAQVSTMKGSVALLSGGLGISTDTGASTVNYMQSFGRFDTRYTTPRTTAFISQPFSNKEYDLFYFETLSDGAFANDKFKISIVGIKPSSDPSSAYGSFEVQLREFDDTDIDPRIIERYPDCNLDPDSDRFIGRIIGDLKVSFNFDAEIEDERRLVIKGRYGNKSAYVRVQVLDSIYRGDVPKEAVPFGFRGIPVLKTNDSLTDTFGYTIIDGGVPLGPVSQSLAQVRLQTSTGSMGTEPISAGGNLEISASIIPPLPYRFKNSRGEAATSPNFIGEAGGDERADSRYYWGVMNTNLPVSRSQNPVEGYTNALFRTNEGNTFNRIVNSYTKFMGIQKLDTLVTGAGADAFNNNKFTLARVALPCQLDASGHITDVSGVLNDLIKNTVYIRNAKLSTANYVVQRPVSSYFARGRITLATLLNSSSVVFNRFGNFAKFTNIFYGGFDGLNILDKDQFLMNDKATSTTTPHGEASTSFTDTCLNTQPNGITNPAGRGKNNSTILAYRQAARLLTDPHISNASILTLPGIRDELVVDYVAQKVKENGQMFYLMDLQSFDENSNRIYASDGKVPDVENTAEQLDARNIDNNYVGTYFPDVWIEDSVNRTVARVPASIPALSALGLNDKAARPWFAPAGFARGSLDFVTNVDVRLSAADRDTLYESRINPIAVFPNVGFVIFGQKNLQAAKTALDRINVRRMLIEVKRLMFTVARGILFDQNTQVARDKFLSQATPLLALVQAQQGIEQFKLVMDDTNNTPQDFEDNRLNGRIIVVPTRTVEFIAIDFIITQTGVSFE